MDKKFIERPNKFNKREYDSNYQKTHYKRITVDVKPELKKSIDDYCFDHGISKSEFLRQALEALENK